METTTTPSREKALLALTPENYAFLDRYIHQETGIALGQDKQYLLESRLMPVLEDERIGSLNELCNRLRQGVPEALRRRIAESMTTRCRPYFFRDPAVFDALRNQLLPEIARRRESEEASASGRRPVPRAREPYTLAMLLCGTGYADWKIEILGTDLSSRILARATAAKYLQIEVNRGLPAQLLVKYFLRAGIDWQLREEIRRMVRFAPFDLRQSMAGMGPFDIVLCRNVLIYFDIATRKKIVSGIRSALTPGGYLLLGATETTFNLDADFTRRTVGTAVAYQCGH